MTTWIPITREEHSNSCWEKVQSLAFASELQVTEVLGSELSRLLPHYVLGFVIKEDISLMVALLGLGGNRNLYVNSKNQWSCEEMPFSLCYRPFQLMTSEETGERILCIDQDKLTNDEKHNNLFDEEGELTTEVNELLTRMSKHDGERRRTRSAVSVLHDAGLLEPWTITVSSGKDEDPSSISGLYRINEKSLNNLSGDRLELLNSNSSLMIAYAQLFSMNQTKVLGKRAQLIGKELEMIESKKQAVSELFSDQDSLNFDAL